MAAEIKPIGDLNRSKLGDVVPLSTPFSVYIFPTTYCNFKCHYCAHSLGLEKMKEQYDFSMEHMTLDTFQKTVEQLKEFPEKIKVVSLTGQGEPLLNPHIPEMVRLLKEAQVCHRVEIISNGALLHKEMADGLIDAGLDSLRISLQGLTAKKYFDICKYKLDYPQFLENLKYYHQNKKESMQLFVKTLDVTLEQGEESAFYDMFSDICDRMFVETCQPAYDGVASTKDLDTSTDRYGGKHEERKVCPACFYMLGVLPSGEVEPCDTIYKPIILGSVHTHHLRDLWQGDKLKEFWTMQLEGKRYDNPRCKVCCAPDDIARPEDVLDPQAEDILKRL